ncbi:MAG: M13-type metalloendopeptidase [Pseudomonadota bacterium]|nr:M13-type metalloendopeptidase [Pseudomonadota bacterium]
MIRFIAAALASTALAGCAAQMQPAPPMVAALDAPPPAPVAEAIVAAPKPEIGSFGFDSAGMDHDIRAGDDFYNYANGTWAKTTPIPADKSGYGMFTKLDDVSRERTHQLIEDSAKDPNSRIGATFASFMDEAGIEARGLTGFNPWLDQVRGLKSKAGLAALYAQADKYAIDTPFGDYVGQDDKLPEQYSLSLAQSGLGMPDRDYYLSKDAKLVDTKTKYLQHLTTMLTLAGEADAAARAKAILNFESKIAAVSWTKVQNRDATKVYNKMTLAQLQKLAPGFDFRTLFRDTGAPVDSLIVAQPSAIKAIAGLIARAPLGVLKDQLLVRSLDGYAAYLPKSFDQEHFSFYGTTLSGTPQQRDRWKRGVDFTVDTLGDEVSQLYVAKYFPPATKAAADELVHNIIGAMDRRLDQLDWMTAETKVKAHAKLAAFTPKIGYPSQWRDMTGLQVDRGDVLANAMRSAEFEHAYNVGHLGGPIRRWEWGMTPMTINAYANPGLVEIVFPAAILQPPFFDPNADPAINYGGIGAVIGHELSHHFDDQGAKYNAEGRLTDWWTKADVDAFNSRLDKLGKQYDAYEPLPGMHVQGKLTMGENVADLAGLTIAHDAYIASLKGQTPPIIDGTTGDQRFYLGWAQVWRNNIREASIRQRLLVDPHSPPSLRVSTVRNLDPWYQAFGVQPGQALYLTPEQRVRIW